jgi:hypothetical protein
VPGGLQLGYTLRVLLDGAMETLEVIDS